MKVRPGFLYALFAVVAIFLAFNAWQAFDRIERSQEVLKTIEEGNKPVVINKDKTWQAADLLQETLTAAQKNEVEWLQMSTDPASQSQLLRLRGGNAQLLAFYQWFEKHAQVRSVKEMEIGDDGENKRVLQITFDW